MGLLSETQIRATKPGVQEYFLNDGDNLFLCIRRTAGSPLLRDWSSLLPVPGPVLLCLSMGDSRTGIAEYGHDHLRMGTR